MAELSQEKFIRPWSGEDWSTIIEKGLLEIPDMDGLSGRKKMREASMPDNMRLFSLTNLYERIFGEYRETGSIMDVPESSWYRPSDSRQIPLVDQNLETVLGPAAGPHTQLAVNIVASYLTGSRFIELKTVQILDALEIEKPCIDMRDEGYNTEWSTELTLQDAWEEYAKAWILVHVIEELFFDGDASQPRFLFNMSVGYDLKGIQEEPMQQYIKRMMDSSREERFQTWLEETEKKLPKIVEAAGLDPQRIKGISSRISGKICNSVTLSTMHGCPPAEIESICSYLLKEFQLYTYVKLNPTLHGYEKVREVLDNLGYGYIQLNPEGFEHDLQWSDALPMLHRLNKIADEQKLIFGIKLSNTLAVKNNQEELPGEEQYMSGRSLFPLTIGLAALLSKEFEGKLPISFSGGVNRWNVKELFETGIRPITIASDFLKPGGYLRQTDLAKILEASDGWDLEEIDPALVEKLYTSSLEQEEYRKHYRGKERVSTPGPLPQYDCFVAPCVSACAISQHIPEYIRLVGEQRYGEALELIYERNALPSITGHICDHACQLKCTRKDYEGTVHIREIKKLAVLHGFDEYRSRIESLPESNGIKVAVIGAGPSGLSAAYFLAREGYEVEVFERAPDAGGVIRYIVPHFRIPREAIASDVDHIAEMGVKFHFNWQEEIDTEKIKARGFRYVIMGLGTYQPRRLEIAGEGQVFQAYNFLDRFNRDSKSLSIGKTPVVVGAGDTAMDCARAALRSPGVESVQVVYRRSIDEMPASEEEYELAVEDQVGFNWLKSPVEFNGKVLKVELMELGEADASGRRRPVGTGRFEELEATTVIYAIGDDPDAELLKTIGLSVEKGKAKTDPSGLTEKENVFLIGDGRTGSSTIVRCVQEGRNAADAICEKEARNYHRPEFVPFMDPAEMALEVEKKKSVLIKGFHPRKPYKIESFAKRELSRCLECNHICNKCVDVCPNRSNITLNIDQGFQNMNQIIHLDAYCNECGNCGTFCPWDGNPYLDKPTVFSHKADFSASKNPGWFLEGARVFVRDDGEVKDFDLVTYKAGEDELALIFKELHDSRPELFAPEEGR
jgi:putative selenate reductase